MSGLETVYRFLTVKLRGSEEMNQGIDDVCNAVSDAVEKNICNPLEVARILCSVYLNVSGRLPAYEKKIVNIYVSLFQLSLKNEQILQFLQLGKAVSILIRAATTYGTKVLSGCSLELPFGVTSCQPAKFSIMLNSLKELSELQTLWCNVYRRIVNGSFKDSGLVLDNLAVSQIVFDLAELMGASECGTTGVHAVCDAVCIVTARCLSHSDEMKVRCLSGMISWLNFAFSRTCGGKLNGQGFTAASTEQHMNRAVAAVCGVVKLLLRGDGDEENTMLSCGVGRGCSTVKGWALNALQPLLETHVVQQRQHIVHRHSAELDSPSTASPAAAARGADCPTERLAAMFAANILDAISQVVALPGWSGISPPLPFLVNCCVDLGTLRIVSDIIVKRVRAVCRADSRILPALLQCLQCLKQSSIQRKDHSDPAATTAADVAAVLAEGKSSRKKARFVYGAEGVAVDEDRYEGLLLVGTKNAKRNAASATVTPMRNSLLADAISRDCSAPCVDSSILHEVAWLVQRVEQLRRAATLDPVDSAAAAAAAATWVFDLRAQVTRDTLSMAGILNLHSTC